MYYKGVHGEFKHIYHLKFIKIDTWLIMLSRYAGDLNETYFVGNVDEESRRLVKCTYECLEKAISIGISPLNFNFEV